jgi:pimeloyl-ACP methyl ester carboxylesterase
MNIDTLEAVDFGDATEWIRIRGTDPANPVLLLIQQGPGLPMINEARRFERSLGLEQAFTVVYWDQRGCGRSLRGPQDQVEISLARMVGDTVSLLELLRDRFGREIYVARLLLRSDRRGVRRCPAPGLGQGVGSGVNRRRRSRRRQLRA